MGCGTADKNTKIQEAQPVPTENDINTISPTVYEIPVAEKTNEPESETDPAENSYSQDVLESTIDEKALHILGEMSLEDKVAQMFVVFPESLVTGVSCVTSAGEATESAINTMPVGGFIYLTNNLKSYEQVTEMLDNVQTYSINRTGLPMFLCVDEEGGAVTRVAESGIMNVVTFDNMPEIGARNHVDEALLMGQEIGHYLNELGFNVDFAPVADVITNQENKVVKNRSFGSDPVVVSNMAAAVAKGLKESGVLPTYKHFPGHGNTSADTHAGYAYSGKSLDELYLDELIPFQKGIEENVPFIMMGHISLPNITGNDIPASISYKIVTELLRNDMNYDGIIITDALNMGAIKQQYSSSEAAIMAIEAGNDMLLEPADFNSAYNGVITAVIEGRISEERINESVLRIIKAKLSFSK